MSDTPAGVAVPPAAPVHENIGRGTLAALLTIPVGVAAWVLIWALGYVASLVGLLVAFLALRLYVWGAGRISRPGAAVVLVTTVITLLLAFLGGIVYDAAVAFGDASGLSAFEAVTHPDFWPLFGTVLPEALPDYRGDLLWAIGFGALGAFATLRTAFAAASTADEPAAAPLVAPVVPPGPTSEPTHEPANAPTTQPAVDTTAPPQPAPDTV